MVTMKVTIKQLKRLIRETLDQSGYTGTMNDKVYDVNNPDDLYQLDMGPDMVPPDATHAFSLDVDDHGYGTVSGWIFTDGTIMRNGDGEEEDPADLFPVDAGVEARVKALL